MDAEQLLQLFLHAEIALAAGVGVIRPEHGGFHVIAHGVDAGVGEHIQEDVAVVELEGVVAGVLHFLQPLGGGQQVQFLYDTNLVHFQGDGVVFVKCDLCHFCSPLFYTSSQ